jgi:hypothetical protein
MELSTNASKSTDGRHQDLHTTEGKGRYQDEKYMGKKRHSTLKSRGGVEHVVCF